MDEFAFVDLILTKHPKSGETWAHRGWLYRQLHAAEQHASATLNVRQSYPTPAHNPTLVAHTVAL